MMRPLPRRLGGRRTAVEAGLPPSGYLDTPEDSLSVTPARMPPQGHRTPALDLRAWAEGASTPAIIARLGGDLGRIAAEASRSLDPMPGPTADPWDDAMG